MSTPLTPPTPENVAEMLTSDDGIYHDGNDWGLSLTRDGNVVRIGIEPLGEDEMTDLPKVHFRAIVVEGETVPLILNRERYAGEVASLVEQLVKALAGSVREEYPIHVAQLRGSLLDLADESAAPPAAVRGKASLISRSCACSEFGQCPGCGGSRADERLVDGPNGAA